MKRFFIVLLTLCLSTFAHAQQNQVKQSGFVTPGHAPYWVTNGIIGDAGTAASNNLTSIGTTGQGPTICANSAPITSVTGYQRLCFGVTTALGATISLQNYGSSPAGLLSFVINGSTYPFPFAGGGNVLGPNSSVLGDLVCWNNTAGSLVSDCGTTARTRLLTSTVFYIDVANGTDQTGCGASSGTSACKTVQYLINALIYSYDLGGQAVTIQLANSGTSYAPFQIASPWVGAGVVTVQGNLTTPTDVVIDGSGGNYCVQIENYAAVTVQGMTVQNCAIELGSIEGHSHLYFQDINFGAPVADGISIYCSRLSYCEAIGGGNTISGVGSYFIEVAHQGNFRAAALSAGATVFTLTNNLTVSSGYFAYSSSLGDITFTEYTSSAFNSNGFTTTGVKWEAEAGGHFQILNSATGVSLTPNFFPGSFPGYCIGDCEVDQAGHGPAAGSGTTLVSCGTGSPAVSGNDYYATVTEGSSATSCSIVFASPFAQAPYCLVQFTNNGVTALPVITQIASTVSALGITHSSASGATFNYFCKGF